jgi:hypothetical protein
LVRRGNFYREFNTQLFYVLTNTHLDLALLHVRAGGIVMDAYSGLLYASALDAQLDVKQRSCYSVT